MRLNEQQVAEIRASQGCYRASDVARAYEVHPSTVTRIWAGSIHEDIQAHPEPPNIVTKPKPRDLEEDINILLQRGMSHQEVADHLGISKGAVSAYRGFWS